ncbi:Polycystic kidney disease [Chamberlinius hualienensis]
MVVEISSYLQRRLIRWPSLMVIYIIYFSSILGSCWDIEMDKDIKIVVVGQRCSFRLNVLPGSSCSSSSLSSLMTSSTVRKRLDVSINFDDGSNVFNYTDYSWQMFRFEHTYIRDGHFVVRIKATDSVLLKTVVVNVTAILLTDLIHLQLPQSPMQVFPVSREVVAELFLYKRQLLPAEFIWDFGENIHRHGWPKVIRSNSTYQIVVYCYSVPGVYHLVVTVKSVALCEPLTASKQLIVVETIDNVHLQLSHYKMPISKLKNGTLMSDKDQFDAQTSNGSHINFIFNLGDNTKLTMLGGNNQNAETFHHYTTEGVYSVCVPTSNALSKRSNCCSEMVYVERLPEGLRLNREHYIGRVGETIRFEAHLNTTPNNVAFDWRLGNDVLLLNAGFVVEHVFTLAGSYHVSVTARNAVTSDRTAPKVAKVSIRDVLTDIQVRLVKLNSSNTVIISTDDDVELLAIIKPSLSYNEGLHYIWKWEHKLEQKTLTNTLREDVFAEPGWFKLTVTVDNYVSSVTSSPLQFQVLERINEGVATLLSFYRHRSSTTFIRGEGTSFTARHFRGSNVTYRWDFGDGTEDVTTVPYVNYTYLRVGEFMVNVLLWNLISNASASTTVFVVNNTKEWCDKPAVRILGIQDQAKIWKVEDGEEKRLHLEAAVDSVDCRLGGFVPSVVYHWKVVYAVNTNSNGNINTTRLFASDRRWLNVFTNQLPIGNHTLHLKVGINGSIVYNVIKTRFTVVSRPLRAGLTGGSSRWVGRLDNVTITGIVGHYDARKCRNCLYSWSCAIVHNPNSKCFIDEAKVFEFNQNRIETYFLTSWLDLSRFQSFIVGFNVSSDHHLISSASQVIHASQHNNSIQIGVSCLNCFEGEFVSKYQSTIFETECFNCSSEVQIEWQLWLVHDEFKTLPISYYDCVQPDGSTFFWRRDRDKNISTTIKTDDRQSNASLMQTTLISRPPGKFRADFKSRQLFLTILESHTHFHPFQGMLNISEGSVEKDVSGRRIRFKRRLISPFVYPSEDNYKIKKTYHRGYLMELVPLMRHETTTGVNQRQLVIEPGTLKAGRTYRVIVNAQHNASSRWLPGRAELNIWSLRGPYNGRCSITPHHGVAYLTTFLIYCWGWIGEFDDYHPLVYELRYSTSSDNALGTLIRLSLDKRFKFVLPSGLSSNNYTIYLNVIVHENGGGSTKVCSISKTVRRPTAYDDKKMVSILKNEVGSRSSNLMVLLQRDDLGSLLHRLQTILVTVNDIYRRFEDDRFCKVIITRIKINYLKHLIVYTEEESLLSLGVVEAILQLNLNVNANLFKTMVSVVQNSTIPWLNYSGKRSFENSYFFEFAHLFINTVSSLHSLSNGSRLLESMRLLEFVTNRLLIKIQSTDMPWELITKSFINFAMCRETKDRILMIDTRWVSVQFRVMNNMDERHFCIITHIVKDYTAGRNVLSLGLYRPSGLRLPLSDVELTAPVMVRIPRPVSINSRRYFNGSLSPFVMDTYSFKLTEYTLNQALILKIDLNFLETGQFPFTAFVSFEELPCSDYCIYQKSIEYNMSNLISVIPGKHFNKLGKTYYIGIVNEGYKSKYFGFRNEYISVNYSLSAEFVKCLQNDLNSKLPTNSSVVTNMITDDTMIHCSFDKISQYSTLFYQVSLSYNTIDVDILLRRPFNLSLLTLLTLAFLSFAMIQIVLSRLQTKSRRHSCGIRVAENNSVFDDYAYLVKLYTGYGYGSGTTAKVCIELHSEDGFKESRRLVSGDQTNYVIDAASSNLFLVTLFNRTKSRVSPIRKIKIWHDNYGSSPAFYLRSVIVTDIKTGNSRYFEFNKWFSTIENDQIVREAYANPISNRSYKEIFMQVFLEYKYKLCLWNYSCQDHFTVWERLLCHFLWISLTFMSMIVLRIWTLNLAKEDIFESQNVSWQTTINSLFIGLILSAVAVIPGLLLQFSLLVSCKDDFSVSNSKPRIIDSFNMNEPDRCAPRLQEWEEKQRMNDGTSFGTGSLNFKMNELRGIRTGPSKPFVMPVWYRHLIRILSFSSTVASLIFTYYHISRFTMEMFIILVQLVIFSIAIGQFIGYPLLVAMFSVIITLRRKSKRFFTAECCCNYHHFDGDRVDQWINKEGSNDDYSNVSKFIDKPLYDEQLLKYKMKGHKKSRSVLLLKKLGYRGIYLLILIILVFAEGPDGHQSIKRSFLRKYSLKTVFGFHEWLNWITDVISKLSLHSGTNSFQTIWLANDYNSIIPSDYLLCVDADSDNSSFPSCFTLSRKKENATLKIKELNETVFGTQLRYTKSELYIVLFNVATNRLSVITSSVEFINDSSSNNIDVHSLGVYSSNKAIYRSILLYMSIRSLKSLIASVLNYQKKFKVLNFLWKTLFTILVLFYLSLNIYISNMLRNITFGIINGNMKFIDVRHLLSCVKISRCILGIVGFMHLLCCVNLSALFWTKCYLRAINIFKCIWKILIWSTVSLVLVTVAFSSFAWFLESSKSSRFTSPLQMVYSFLILLTTRNCTPETLCHYFYRISPVYNVAYFLMLLVVGYWMIRICIAALKTIYKDKTLSYASCLSLTSFISLLKLKILQLRGFRFESPKKISSKSVSTDMALSILESQMEEMMERLERYYQSAICDDLCEDEFDDVFLDNDCSDDLSLAAASSCGSLEDVDTKTLKRSASTVWPTSLYSRDTSTATSHKLHRSKTLGKGVIKEDLEMCRLSCTESE